MWPAERLQSWLNVGVMLAVVGLALWNTSRLLDVMSADPLPANDAAAGDAAAGDIAAGDDTTGGISREQAFYRHNELLGPDHVVLERIQADFPPGTVVSVPIDDGYRPRVLLRITRLWLALLPDYPISSTGSLLVCVAQHCALEPGDVVLERGRALVLVKRGP